MAKDQEKSAEAVASRMRAVQEKGTVTVALNCATDVQFPMPDGWVMLDVTYLKAHRTAASLLKTGLFSAASDIQEKG